MLGLVILLTGFVLTYSWPFLDETLPYAYTFINGTSIIAHSTGSVSSCGGGDKVTGCPAHYEWCGTTTKSVNLAKMMKKWIYKCFRPNVWVYVATWVLAGGMAMPMLRLNLDILYSKVLGNIKQVGLSLFKL